MKRIPAFLFMLYSVYTFAQGDGIVPRYTVEGLEILDEAEGDLDRDGIAEKVIVCNTNDTGDLGIIREIQVYKMKNNGWMIWKRSRNAILESMAGGIMGDPFQALEIKDGILLVDFYGGSSWRWSYTDKYRFQNGNFELIGYSGMHGSSCKYWQEIDFNLSTGKVIVKKQTDPCDSESLVMDTSHPTETESFYQKGIYINMDNRMDTGVKIVSPIYKLEFYL